MAVLLVTPPPLVIIVPNLGVVLILNCRVTFALSAVGVTEASRPISRVVVVLDACQVRKQVKLAFVLAGIVSDVKTVVRLVLVTA